MSRGPSHHFLVDPNEKQAYDEVAAILDAAYYQIGDTFNWTAPAIDGYQLPDPSSGTVVLGVTTNTLDWYTSYSLRATTLILLTN